MPSSLSHHCCPLPRAAIYYHHLPPTIHHSLSVLCHPPLITYLPFTLTTFPSSSAAPCPAFMNSYHPLFIAYHPLLPPHPLPIIYVHLSLVICHPPSITYQLPPPITYHSSSPPLLPAITVHYLQPHPPSSTTLHHHPPSPLTAFNPSRPAH